MSAPTSTTIRDRAFALWQAGLQPLYLSQNQAGKWTPQTGTTGNDAPWPAEFPEPPATGGNARLEAAVRLAFRVPDGAIVIDVDNHTDLPDEQAGPGTLSALETRLGPLPLTFKLTARGAERRVGKYGFRIPAGTKLHEGALRDAGGSIDLIQHHHRFVFAPGHAKDGPDEPCSVVWSPDGTVVELPAVADWPELPEAWLAELGTYAFGRGAGGQPQVRYISRQQAEQNVAEAWQSYYGTPGGVGQGARDKLLRASWFQACLDQMTGEPADFETLLAAHPDFAGVVPGSDSTAWKACEQGKAYAESRPWVEAGGDDMINGLLGDHHAEHEVSVQRELLDVTNPGEVGPRLQQQLGTGPTSGLFLRDGKLVHIARITGNGFLPPQRQLVDTADYQVVPIGQASLAAILTRQYQVVKVKKDPATGMRFYVAALPPADVLKVIADPSQCSGLRVLSSVVSAPVFRESGTLIADLGYDDETGVAYLSAEPVEPPSEVTGVTLAAAVELLGRIVADFPFETPHDRANFYGALFTPLLVRMLPPPWKLVEFSAPQPGSGKSLLAELLVLLHTGVKRGMPDADEAELGKSITSILETTTGGVVVFDNVSGVLKSDNLARLISEPVWSDRLLGKNSNSTKRNDRLWALTANNLTLSGDLARRVLRVRIDAGVPHPEDRKGFAIPQLQRYVRDHRVELLQALYTVVLGWVQDGRPGDGVSGGDGFSRWRGGMRSLLEWSQLAPGGVFDSEDIRPSQAEQIDDGWSDFLQATRDHYGEQSWLIAELLAVPVLMNRLPVRVSEKFTEQAKKSSLGMLLKQRKNTWFGTLAAQSAGYDGHAKTNRWRVISAEPAENIPKTEESAGTAGTCGYLYGPTRRETETPREGPGEYPQAPAVPADLKLPVILARGSEPISVPIEMLPSTLRSWAGARVVVDVEHSGYPIGHPNYWLRTVQIGNSNIAVVLDATDPTQLELAREVLAAAGEVVAHSPTADLVPLEVAGVVTGEIWDRTTDTAVLSALAPPNYRGKGDGNLKLKALAAHNLGETAVAPEAEKAKDAAVRRLGKGKWLKNTTPLTPVERSGWAQIPSDDPAMVVYAASDVLDTGALQDALPPLPPELALRERRTLAITSRAARRGFALDTELLAAKLEETRTRADAAAAELEQFGITEPRSTTKLGVRFTELGAHLPQTKTGKDSTAKRALLDLAATGGDAGQAAEVLLRWRKDDKLLSSFLNPWTLQIEHGDGRLRPTIYTVGAAATGRMSCAQPNLQQVPRGGGVRGCILPDPGMVFVSADFSAVEVRVAAALSQDPMLLQLLATGGDLHAEVAKMVYGPGYTKDNRYTAKGAVFGRFYGSGIGGIAESQQVSQDRAGQIVQAIDAVIPAYGHWAKELGRQVQGGRLSWDFANGRQIWFDRDRSYAACAYAVQGTARELLVDALLQWETTRFAGCTVLPVHDELLVMVPEADAAEAAATLQQCMTSELHGVAITAEASEPAARWLDSI